MAEFGFNTRKEALPQMLHLLGLSHSDQAAKAIKETCRELSWQYLNPELRAWSQKEAHARITDQLSQRFPHFFDKQDRGKRLHFALRHVIRLHTRRRCEEKRCASKPLGGRNHEEFRTDINESIYSEEGKGIKTEYLYDVLPGSTKRDVTSEFQYPTGTPKNSYPAHRPLLPTRLMTKNQHTGTDTSQIHSNSVTSSPDPALRDFHKSAALKTASQGHEITQIADTNQPDYSRSDRNINDNQVQPNAIRKFLEKCHPHMVPLLANFAEYGCTTEYHLRSIAAFSRKKRRDVLRKILKGRLDADQDEVEIVVAEMDLDILEDELERYLL